MAQATKSLADLGLTARGGRDARIAGLAVDSRDVRDGFLFAALPGTKVHGASFIPTALAQGATAILTDAEGAALAAEAIEAAKAALVIAEDPRGALSATAALWFGAQPATMVAVTGTNGKTSASTFCRQLWMAMGHAAVNLGTTGVEGAWELPLKHTTPEPITLHRALAEAAANGITHAAMEASSHGLDQRRLDGVHLKAAGFTNFTQDHLDYHHTFEAYFDAKMGLFERVLPEEGVAVVNIDDPKGFDVARRAIARGQRVIRTGRAPEADLRLDAQRFDATGQDLRFFWQGKPHQVRLNLIGGFQAENVLVAAGMVIGA
ncbi:MAG: UDP-N-acetylmuramoyl-L-alanyl-D-glutamate--2,6-diaminopimelate ligase, partial [Rhodobacteraceae bacterium]|nr:UDP-N-acetylmuramoyl-L-alanyl-D-glutamate--2,6-diaminopimelate ligase [Paracoccaceae bacterium]